MSAKSSKSVQRFFQTRKLEHRLIYGINGLFTGVWLGLLDREALYEIDKVYYDGDTNYQTKDYNEQGLWEWEEGVVSTYFQECSSILVAGAGGGREVLALRRLGFEADGFECHPDMVRFANKLLSEEGYSAKVYLAERDACPEGEKRYDGLIVGWGAYMHIWGRDRRIAFLESMRCRAQPEAPILVSFYDRQANNFSFRIAARVANGIRKLRRKEGVDVGDWLSPSFTHYFTRDEIAAELEEAGFKCVHFSREDYAHAVGKALPDNTVRRTTVPRKKSHVTDRSSTPGQE